MMTEELPILKGILNGVVNYHNAPVRFGRVPKREKARILAAMQQSTNSRSQEKAVAAELEDDQRLLSAVIGAHLETCDFTRDKVEPMLIKARDQPSYTACPPTLACPLNPNPQPLTGQQELLQDFSKRFSPAIRGVVEFAKRIPGFSHLTQEDQVTLLKAGVFEVLLVRLACMFDTQNNSMICLNGQVLKRESIHTSSNARFLLDSMFDFAERLNSLRLSDAEIGLFSSIVVIAADRPGLRNTDLIEKMHNKLKAGLQLVINQNHPGQPNLCQELMKKIPDLRTLNTLHSEKLLAFKMTEQQQLAQQQQSSTTSSSSWSGMMMMGEEESKSPSGSSSWSSSSDVAMEEVKSPLGSVSSTESMCSGEVASLSDYQGGQTASAPLLAATLAGAVCPLRHRANSGSTSGDEIKDVKPVILHHHRGFNRKLDSPSDSGIESGTEKLEKHTSSAPTSVCSSPRSSVEDKEDQSHHAHVEDMPVLKRVLQAPPLYDTNSLMDEAYKPHKKFRALRNKDCAEAESAVVMEHQPQPQPQHHPLHHHHHHHHHHHQSAVTTRTPPPQQQPIIVQQQQTSSLSSTHSTLAKSLMEVPRMTPEQMKRTDIIHNYIMRGTVESSGSGSCPYSGGGGSSPHSVGARWPSNGTSVITTTSRAVAATSSSSSGGGSGYPQVLVNTPTPPPPPLYGHHSPSVSPCPSSSSSSSSASSSQSGSSPPSVVELQVGTQPLNLSKKTPPPSPRPMSAPKALSLEA